MRGRWHGALLVLFATLPSICLASAAGPAPWSQLEFSSPTNLGILHVKATTTFGDEGMRLELLSIDLDGKPLLWPKKIDLRVKKPQLNKMEVVSTRTITCLGDECPDFSDWPVWLYLPFGDNPANDGDQECDYSTLAFHFSPDGIEDITMFTCSRGKDEERVLYSRE